MCNTYTTLSVYVCTAGMHLHTHSLNLNAHSRAHIHTHIKMFNALDYSTTHNSHTQIAIKMQAIFYSRKPRVQLARQSYVTV